MAKTIRSQSQLFFKIFSGDSVSTSRDYSRTQNKMRTNLNNLRTVYDTALGEIPNRVDALSLFSPAIIAMEQLGYFFNTAADSGVKTTLTKGETAPFIYFFEAMAQSIEQQQLLETFDIPNIPRHPQIRQEINALQETLTLGLNQSAKQDKNE
ncbi:hypothetical protein [Lentibacillus salinarum]|uniref:Uncharacterized protein n=1 Tax=Lentibacillus salinarum TaxID=446820 RepID=A0ABW3ZS88_9BACI